MRHAIDELACSPDSLSERIEAAATKSLIYGLRDAEQGGCLPAALTDRMQSMMGRLSASSREVDAGKAHATLAAMDTRELTDIASDIVSVALDVLAADPPSATPD